MIEAGFFWGNFLQYWGNMLYAVLYLAGLVYFARYGSKLMKQIFVWPFVILLLTAYNPLVMGIVIAKTDWQDRYYRFFWVLPVQILCSYLFAVLIEQQKAVSRKVVVAVFVLCMVLMSGNMPIQKIASQNIYKMDGYILELAKLIEEKKDTEQPVIVCDQNVYYQIRQYDASLIEAVNNSEMSLYGWLDKGDIDSSEQYKSDGNALSMFVRGVEVDPDLIHTIFQQRSVTFFVRNKEYYSQEYMQELDYLYVGSVDGYELYQCVEK